MRLLHSVQCEETLALLLLVLSRIDHERFVRLESEFRASGSLEVRIATYWAWVLESVTDSESSKFWQAAWGRLELLTASPPEIQAGLVGQVQATDDPRAIAVLISGMESPDLVTRNVCALFLSPSHENNLAMAAYRKVLLHDESPVMRQSAARALSGTASPDALQALRTAVQSDASEEVRIEAIRALAAGASDESVGFLLDRFRSSTSVGEQRAIVAGLAPSKSSNVRDFLRTLVTGNLKVCIKSDALDALALMRDDPVATMEVVGALSSEDDWIRMKAALLLAKMGDRTAIPYLERISQTDPNADVRQHALDSIEQLRK